MGRSIEFNKEQLLRKNIMPLFWQQGFSGTSVDDICKESGLTKPSLYNSFGNKEDVFVASLNLYKTFMQKKLNSLPQDERFIKCFFKGILNEPVIDSKIPSGCFIMNSFTEFSNLPNTDIKKSTTEESWKMLESYFKNSIVKAKNEKRISKNTNPNKIAKWLMTQVYALRGWSKYSSNSHCKEIYNEVMLKLQSITLAP